MLRESSNCKKIKCGNINHNNGSRINAEKELGFRFYSAKNIKVLMVEGAVLNAECRLFKEIELGDHVMLVGEVVEASLNNGK